MRRRFLAMILMSGLLLVGVAAASPVSAQTALTADLTSATLVAKGAAVDVELIVTCEAGFLGRAVVTITQRSSKTVTQGGAFLPQFVCTGEPQIVTVRVVANAGGAPFKVGDAVVGGGVTVCDEFGFCQNADIDDIVRIRR